MLISDLWTHFFFQRPNGWHKPRGDFSTEPYFAVIPHNENVPRYNAGDSRVGFMLC
jgi:hypothetical protein